MISVIEEQKETEEGAQVPKTMNYYTCNGLPTSNFPEYERESSLLLMPLSSVFLVSTTLLNANNYNYSLKWFTS